MTVGSFMRGGHFVFRGHQEALQWPCVEKVTWGLIVLEACKLGFPENLKVHVTVSLIVECTAYSRMTHAITCEALFDWIRLCDMRVESSSG